MIIFGFFTTSIKQFLVYSLVKALTETLLITGQLYFDYNSHQQAIRLLGNSVFEYYLSSFILMIIFAVIFFSLGIISAKIYKLLVVRIIQNRSVN